MKADHAEQTRLESMLDWHADLIANGHADRAGSMARRIRVDTGSSLLFAIAEAVAETLAPVAPDPGFRRHLRARLENPTACSKGDTAHIRAPALHRLPSRLPGMFGGRGVLRPPAAGSANDRTRDVITSVTAASIVALAAMWWFGHVCRRMCLAAHSGDAPSTPSGHAPAG